MSTKTAFSKLLYNYRKENQITQEKMAELCELSVRHYRDLEIGIPDARLSTAVRIAHNLDISLDGLKDDTSQAENPSA